MRRLLFLLGCLIVYALMVGSTDWNFRYWFDDDVSNIETKTAVGTTARTDIDVSQCKPGFHLLYVQAYDENGDPTPPKSSLFFVIPDYSKYEAMQCVILLDGEKVDELSAQSNSGLVNLDIDVQALAPGLHKLDVIMTDQNGNLFPVKSSLFLREPMAMETVDGPMRCLVLLDGNNAGEQQVQSVGGIINLDIDVQGLSTGLHKVDILLADMRGNLFPVKSSLFLREPQRIENLNGPMRCLVLFDGKYAGEQEVVSNDGIINFDIDVSSLSSGLHKVDVQMADRSGNLFPTQSSLFICEPTATKINELSVYYMVDKGPLRSCSENGYLGDGIFKVDLDMESVTPGLHKLSCFLGKPDGDVTPLKTAYFLYTPAGGGKITGYTYWLNNDFANRTNVTVDNAQNTLSLLTMLPVESCPLRSASFHFETKRDNAPYIYANNDFYFIAKGDIGLSDLQKSSFTDFETKEAVDVESITLLETTTNVKRNSPADNEILWYKAPLQTGDSISIKASLACTLEIFDEDGNQLYKAWANGATNFGGIHAQHDGDYYIALHDRTGRGNTVTLNYQHFDKYVVLTHTPRTIGAADAVAHITLKGNGYDKLSRIRLTNGSHDIWANSVKIKDISNLTFSIKTTTSTPLGEYDMVLEFINEKGKTETLTVPSAITLATPKYGEIKLAIKSRRSAATPYPVTVEVKNTGNVEYQMMPLVVGFQDPARLETVELVDFDVMIPKGTKDEIKAFLFTDDWLETGKNGTMIPVLMPTVPPGTQEFKVGFVAGAHDIFPMSVWNYRPWSLPDDIVLKAPRRSPARMADGNTCSLNPMDFIDPYDMELRGCLQDQDWGSEFDNLDDELEQAIAGIYANGDSRRDYTPEAKAWLRGEVLSIEGMLRQKLENCGVSRAKINSIIGKIHGTIMKACDSRIQDLINNYRSGDPNDMLGYLSEAETHDMPKHVEDLSYTIQFENDSTIATADARYIKIVNRIDPNKFDLSTFKPVSIKIGKTEVALDGSQNFSITADMRPNRNAIAQIDLEFDSNGVATWQITALDPLTLDPSEETGILPVNDEGNEGLGEILYDITRRSDLAHGTEISNQATITFDGESSINTPVWTNTLDTETPVSAVTRATKTKDGGLILNVASSDVGSGVWCFDIYMRATATEAWSKVAERVKCDDEGMIMIDRPEDATDASQFCSIAIDFAGNYEVKELTNESVLSNVIIGDVNNDGRVSIADVTATLNNILGLPNNMFLAEAADVNNDGVILIGDVSAITDLVLNSSAMKAPAAKMPAALMPKLLHGLNLGDVTIDDEGYGVTPVMIDGGMGYVASQIEMQLPHGLHIADVATTASTHLAKFVERDGRACIVVYSTANASFNDDHILNITFHAEPGANTDGQNILADVAYVVSNDDEGAHEFAMAPATAMVRGEVSALGDVSIDGLTITTDGLDIVIVAEKAVDITITDVAGHSVVYALSSGVNRLTMPVAGAYLVNSLKVIVR